MANSKSGNNGNNPKKGSEIRVEPIRSKSAIKRIKAMLAYSPLYSAIFSLGINTAFRASDLLSIKVHQVKNLEAGGMLTVTEKKTGKIRRVAINQTCLATIQTLLASRAYQEDDFLFMGQRGVLSVSSLGSLMKRWCAGAGLNEGNYSSHTLRKTWGYGQRVWFNASLPVLVEAFGHSSQKQTLAYLGIQETEIMDLYANVL